MNATDPERLPREPSGRVLIAAGLLLIGLVAGLGGCVEEPLPQRRASHGDCLLNFKLSRIDEALKRCDRVVATFPKDPVPLNDRFLIHSLAGNNQAACRDIGRAAALARQLPPGKADPLLLKDIQQRLEDCRE